MPRVARRWFDCLCAWQRDRVLDPTTPVGRTFADMLARKPVGKVVWIPHIDTVVAPFYRDLLARFEQEEGPAPFEALLPASSSLSELNQFEVAGPPPPALLGTVECAQPLPENPSDLRIFELTPKPCGHRHRHLRTILTCIEKNGVPGFERRALEVGP